MVLLWRLNEIMKINVFDITFSKFFCYCYSTRWFLKDPLILEILEIGLHKMIGFCLWCFTQSLCFTQRLISLAIHTLHPLWHCTSVHTCPFPQNWPHHHPPSHLLIFQGPTHITCQWSILGPDQEDLISPSSKYFSFLLFPSCWVQLPWFSKSQVGYFTGCCTWLQWSTCHKTELLEDRVSVSQTPNLMPSTE